jgi:uncharacterized protein YdbL (DUF1318 family)
MKLYKFFYQFFLLINFLFLNFCFSELRPPPITFTQTQTAAERQMIGEDRELEKDSWLVASIKSSTSGVEDWQSEIKDEFSDSKKQEEYIVLQRIITYTASEIQKLKSFGVVGESLDGNLKLINETKSLKFEKDYSTLESKKRVQELIELVNQTRNRIRQLKLEVYKDKLSPEEYKKLEKTLLLEYWENTLIGEYYENPKGKWRQKE